MKSTMSNALLMLGLSKGWEEPWLSIVPESGLIVSELYGYPCNQIHEKMVALKMNRNMSLGASTANSAVTVALLSWF